MAVTPFDGVNEPEGIENAELQQSNSHNKGDFAAACLPFESLDVALGNLGTPALDMPDHVMIKFLLYLIVGIEDTLWRQYPLSNKLRALKGDAQFREKCRKIFVKWLGIARKRADEFCDITGYEYTDIVFTIP